MTVKLPRRVIGDLDRRIKDQEKRIARAMAYLDELKKARASVEPSEEERFRPNARGGHARALKLSPERRSEISRFASKARWGKDTMAKR